MYNYYSKPDKMTLVSYLIGLFILERMDAMTLEQELIERSGSVCELCGSSNELSVHKVAPSSGTANEALMVCGICKEQIKTPSKIDVNHWHCLNDTIWSNIAPVQVMSYRILKNIPDVPWCEELLDMIYLEDEVKVWANALDEKI